MHPARRQGPFSEAVITLLGLFTVTFLGSLPPPGVDIHGLAGLSDEAARSVSAGALGMAPFIPAFVVVEIAIALWALVSRRPEPGPHGRRWALVVAFVLALCASLVQAHAIAGFLDGLGLLTSRSLLMASLVGLAMATGLVLVAVSRWGMGNGFSLAILASLILQARDRVAWLSAPGRDWADAPSVPMYVLGGGVLLAGCVMFLRAREGRKLSVSVPLLAAGAVPLVLAGFVPPLLHLAGVEKGWAQYGAQAAVILASAVLLSWVFRLPARVKLAVPESAGEGLAQRLVVLGVGSALLLFTLHLGAGVFERSPGFFLSVAIAEVLVAVAVCLDLADRVAFRWRFGLRQVVELAVLHTVFEADDVSRRLSAAGVEHHVQGLRHRSVMYVLAAFVEMRVLVAEADLVRARVALRPEKQVGLDTDPAS